MGVRDGLELRKRVAFGSCVTQLYYLLLRSTSLLEADLPTSEEILTYLLRREENMARRPVPASPT